MENIITAQELANLLKLNEETIYKLTRRGQLPGFKIGDSWRFDMNDILKLSRRRKKEEKNTRT